jgi:hypothetical protein
VGGVLAQLDQLMLAHGVDLLEHGLATERKGARDGGHRGRTAEQTERFHDLPACDAGPRGHRLLGAARERILRPHQRQHELRESRAGGRAVQLRCGQRFVTLHVSPRSAKTARCMSYHN